jgi:hypothetical protein
MCAHFFIHIMDANQHAKNIIASVIGTSVAEFATLPICTIKTNVQNIHSMNTDTSITHVAKELYRKEGLIAFYRSSFPSVFGQIVSSTSKYTLYHALNNTPSYPVKNKMVNGMTAGILSTIMTHPLDVWKIHCQMNKSVLHEYKTTGLLLFYRGYSKTLLKIGISSSMFFPFYDYIKENVPSPMLSAALSATISTVLMHPIDYLKTRHINGLSLYEGTKIRHYYRGLSLNLMRIVPHFAIFMTTVEYVKTHWM